MPKEVDAMSWAETLQFQKSSLRWDIKRSMKSLCKRLADIGEECFVVTVNVNNGWVGHMGSVHGDDFINENIHVPYKFLDFCRDSMTIKDVADLKSPEPALFNSDNEDRGSDGDTPISIEMWPTADTESEDMETDEHHKVESSKPEVKRSTIVPYKNIVSPRKIKLPNKHKGTVYNKTKNPNQSKETSKRGPIIGKAILFSCKCCNQTFKYKMQYEGHLQTEDHKKNRLRDFVCYKCSAQFDGIGSLYRHVKDCSIVIMPLDSSSTAQSDGIPTKVGDQPLDRTDIEGKDVGDG